jgi:uncharacterized protein with HEPN domain
MSEIDPHVQKLLEDIYVSAKRIVDRLQNETREGFLSGGGMDLQDIVARRLTIIGEASAALFRKYPEFCEQHQSIPLRQARGMRNFLVHDYDGVDWGIVWVAVQEGLPQLIDSIAPFVPQKK